jgi:hypothetical protein
MYKALLLMFAVGCGSVIAYVDSRPNWDDTGITAMAILLTSGAFAFAAPNRWWLWAIAVGLWIPLVQIAQTQNYGSLLTLLVALVGAVLGMLVWNGISGTPTVTS